MLLPEMFSASTRSLMGDALFATLAAALAEEPPASVRINPAKCRCAPPGAESVPWCRGGYYLAARPNYTFDPLLHAGYYYVQEASSMFLHLVLSQYVAKPTLMLDLCAAPGGKSTLALAALPAGSAVVCNEPVRPRASVLAENVAKWGYAEAVVTCNTPEEMAASGLTFGVALCDAPCSGEGMFRKDGGAIGEWSAQNVALCARTQRDIVAQAWRCLAPGGLLVYSTCTFNAHENEENVRWMRDELGAESLAVDGVKPEWGIAGSLLEGFDEPVYRFIPGLSRGEGLFMAALRKPDDAAAPPEPRRRRGKATLAAKANGCEEWLRKPDDFAFAQSADTLLAIPKTLAGVYETASQSLRMVQAGVALGRTKGRAAAPCPQLALSTALRREAFPAEELPYAQAIAYLRREAIALPATAGRGYVLLTHGGAPLGFAKNIGPRANNLYPQEWKIKSGHAPEAPVNVLGL